MVQYELQLADHEEAEITSPTKKPVNLRGSLKLSNKSRMSVTSKSMVIENLIINTMGV